MSNKGSANRKQASAEARRILSLLAGRPAEEKDIEREAHGRPFFPGSEIDFSISHSGALAAVSLVKGGKSRIGCDIERILRRPNTPEVAEKFFSAPEKNYIFGAGNLSSLGSRSSLESFDETRFFGIWTLKECFLKLRGLSVFDMNAVPSFVSDEGSGEEQLAFNAAVPSALSFRLYELSGGAVNAATLPAGERYMLATVIEGEEETPPEIRWFSQAFLDCKMIAEIKAAPNPTETVSPKR